MYSSGSKVELCSIIQYASRYDSSPLTYIYTRMHMYTICFHPYIVHCTLYIHIHTHTYTYHVVITILIHITVYVYIYAWPKTNLTMADDVCIHLYIYIKAKLYTQNDYIVNTICIIIFKILVYTLLDIKYHSHICIDEEDELEVRS